MVGNKAQFPGVLWRQCELRRNINTTCYVKSVKKTPLHTYVLKIHVCHVQPFHKKVTESKKGKWGHYFTDLIGRLTWLNTFTVCIYFKYIYCFKLCNNYQKSFNPSTIHPLATISKAISNQHRRVKWEKRGLVFAVFVFCFTDRLLRLRISTVTVKITLGEGPCTTGSEQHRENGSVPLSYFWNWSILAPSREVCPLTKREAKEAQVATTKFRARMRMEKLTARRTAESQPHAHKVVTRRSSASGHAAPTAPGLEPDGQVWADANWQPFKLWHHFCGPWRRSKLQAGSLRKALVFTLPSLCRFHSSHTLPDKRGKVENRQKGKEQDKMKKTADLRKE